MSDAAQTMDGPVHHLSVPERLVMRGWTVTMGSRTDGPTTMGSNPSSLSIVTGHRHGPSSRSNGHGRIVKADGRMETRDARTHAQRAVGTGGMGHLAQNPGVSRSDVSEVLAAAA